MLRRFLGILASVLLFLIGLPSLSGDIARAATMLVGAAWWNYLFMGSGIALFSYTLATWGEKNPFSKVADFFRMPDWYVAAKNKSSFKLYEAACLFIGQKPAWPRWERYQAVRWATPRVRPSWRDDTPFLDSHMR